MSRLALYLLGPPRVERGPLGGEGEPVHIGRTKALALLAYLAVEAASQGSAGQRRDALATMLWPEFDQSGARAELRRALSTLNRALGKGFLTADRDNVGLSADQEIWLDVAQFRRHLAACDAHPHEPTAETGCPECRGRLADAVTRYRDDFMAGFTLPDAPDFDEWQHFQAQSLRDELESALERLAGLMAAQGEYEAAIGHARHRLALDRTHEAAHRALMSLYADAGRRGAALRQYRYCLRALEAELGVAPAEETTALYELIRSGQVGLPEPSRIDALLEPLPTHNLPSQLNPFIGREQELTDLLALIRDPAVRLVSVVGPGGMGKTRLALQAAADALGGFAEGVWLAELARVADLDAVPMAVASALGAQPQPERGLSETLVDAVGTRELLLVLDNCEHVLEGVAPLADQLLSRCPQLTLLATSREALRVPGEQLFEVPAMELPELGDEPERLPTADAVRLFLARAQAVRPGFNLTAENAEPVAEICHRLDGMPLAIELAAARTRALSPQEIAARLDDRFRLLTGGGRTAPERQQTLYNAVTWSYELLEEAERALFDRLSVFRGSFTLNSAEGVCAGDGVRSEDVLDLLASLVEQSLVVAAQSNKSVTRYRLLETLRQYGAGQLEARSETTALRLRHARHFLTWVEKLEPLLDAWEDWAGLFTQLDAESDNLAAAMSWSLEHDQAEIALRLGGALKWWLFTRPQFSQYAAWLRRALQECDDAAPRYRAKALHAVNLGSFQTFHYDRFDEESARLAEQELDSATEAQDPDLVAMALITHGRIARWSGHPERAFDFFHQSLDLGQEMSSQTRIVQASLHLAEQKEPSVAFASLQALLPQTPRSWRFAVLFRLANKGLAAGNASKAAHYVQEAFEHLMESGNAALHSRNMTHLGILAMLQGEYDRAEALLERSCQLARRSGDMTALIEAVGVLGETAWFRGDSKTAQKRWYEAVGLARQHGDPTNVANIQRWLSYAACAAGDLERAEALCLKSLEGFFGDDFYGRGMATLAMARVVFFRGDLTHAAKLFRECLRAMQLARDWVDTVRALEGLAWTLAALERHEEAVLLLGFLSSERERSGMILPPVDHPHHDHALKSAREALGQGTFSAAWAEGEALTLEQVVELALE